nr:MAG TPA: hypothetical protein [Bacteriophage sp.]
MYHIIYYFIYIYNTYLMTIQILLYLFLFTRVVI